MRQNKLSPGELEKEHIIVYKEKECPVCQKSFNQSVARKIKLRNIGSDIDLRQYYDPCDPLYYDIILCQNCGYAADGIFFENLSRVQREKLLNALKESYSPFEYPLVYTEEHALKRHAQAFYCADIKNAPKSEKSYLFLKTAWLFRDIGNKEKEKVFLNNALKGFEEAYSEEEFPICTMDDYTFRYLIGAVHYLCENYTASAKWIYPIVAEQNISPRLKSRALNLKEELRKKTSE